MQACFSTQLYFKSEFKNPEQGFFVHRLYLPMKQKKDSGKAGFNLKAIEFGAFFAFFFFTFLGTLKWYKFSKIVPKHFLFGKLSDKKKPFGDGPSGFKISF